MAKCLRCGAESAWIQGRVRNEPNAEVEELRDDLAEALCLLRTYRYTAEHAIEKEDDARCDALLAKHPEHP